jgi:hypothetical protein
MRKRQAQALEHVARAGSLGTLEVEAVAQVTMFLLVTFVLR